MFEVDLLFIGRVGGNEKKGILTDTLPLWLKIT
nr:MAG TPA: hypothetical protein [Caudoviricetes sp.]